MERGDRSSMPKTRMKRVLAPAQLGNFVYRQETNSRPSDKEASCEDSKSRVREGEENVQASHR